MASKIEVRQGEKFGRFTVISEGERLRLPCGQTNRTLICVCDCGKIKQVRLLHLVRGRINSCGCIDGERHGESKTPLYKRWTAIKNRCNINYRLPRYERLKVEICPEWEHSYLTFKKWAIENGFNETLQIDRIDNNKGYYPENCRFTSVIENCNNRNITLKIIYDGQLKPFMTVIRDKGLINNVAAIRNRIKRGWVPQEAIDTKIRQGNYRKKS